jgi:hypothetical protein
VNGHSRGGVSVTRGDTSVATGVNHPKSHRVVLLTKESDTTALVANILAQRFDEVITVVESPESRFRVARRRAKRIGWVQVGGQLAFVLLVVSVLSRRGRSRVAALLGSVHMASKPIQPRHVESVNAAATREILRQLEPDVVGVLGTRIISSAVLKSIDCPFVNLHHSYPGRGRGRLVGVVSERQFLRRRRPRGNVAMYSSSSTSPPPTTGVLIPSTGATLSGTAATLDTSASNATSVELFLFGGSYGLNPPVICTATLTYYGWVCSWNTTTVPNGSYTLVSAASGPSGATYSLGVPLTVKNLPPTTSVPIPSKGATLSGTAATLDDPGSNATSVEFALFGGSYGLSGHVVGTATPTLYGWIVGTPRRFRTALTRWSR